MAIVVDIDVMLARRKMAVGTLAELVGITPANLAVLKNGRAKAVRFTTLDALCTALETGVIAGAGLDVFENEPVVSDRMKALDNIVLTPHIAAASESAQAAQQDVMRGNLLAFFAGKPPISPVPL